MSSVAELPFVSCVMPTYGRFPHLAHLVGESVESFLRQTYPNKELLILNDCASQILICDIPGVRVVNTAERSATLGGKYNRMVEMARGEIIAPWEDDDLSLPHRLASSVERLGDADYFNPRAYWFLCGDRLQHEQDTGYAHNCSVYRKSAWRTVGGYPEDCRQDAGMDSRLRQTCRVVDGPLCVSESVYIYRWAVGPHLSGNANPQAAYEAFGAMQHATGHYEIRPHWRADYVAMTRQRA